MLFSGIESISIVPDTYRVGGQYTYTEYSASININLTIDAKPNPQVTLVRTDGRIIDFSRVMVSNSAIRFMGPLFGNDSGNYTLLATNAAGTITTSFLINVQCKCILQYSLGHSIVWFGYCCCRYRGKSCPGHGPGPQACMMACDSIATNTSRGFE